MVARVHKVGTSGGGGGGAVYENESADLSGQATYDVTVGTNGNPGGPSILETFPQQNGGLKGDNSTNTTAAGGASGNGNAGAPTGNNGAGGGTIGNYSVTPNGLTSSITGSEVLYGAGRSDGIARQPDTGCGGGGTVVVTSQANQAKMVLSSWLTRSAPAQPVKSNKQKQSQQPDKRGRTRNTTRLQPSTTRTTRRTNVPTHTTFSGRHNRCLSLTHKT